MASSSTSSVQKSFKYDVFLSFRGEDTRNTFVGHLYEALKQKSIETYKDDEKIKKGKTISDELIRAIEDSRFYIIIFSKNYASSSWCLDELVKIMECQKKMNDQPTAYPVFFDVEPTEVRKQNGAVGDAFTKHGNNESAGKWRETLKEAADLAGWELKNTLNGHEAKLVQKIVEEISLELRFINWGVDENLIGIKTRINGVVSSLELGVDDVRIIGIKGMGGAGKTTLARAVYDHISYQFDGCSFVENVREESTPSMSGVKLLQKQVLSDVLSDQGIGVSGVLEGKNMLKKKMHGRKVLIVLDDVDKIEQLMALAGDRSWFKPGSRIIITTRDAQVLIALKVNLVRDVHLLDDKEAMRLFSRHAFGGKIPIEGYKELSEQVVRYAAGLPLTIKVLGSFLCGKDDLDWKDALERLETIPLNETMKVLELSYIDLEEDYKEIFLDVACLLKYWRKDDAIRALESCGFRARIGLRVLELKSLITISENGRLEMHDHIEEMGKNIVRRVNPNKPKRHSRLWVKGEIVNILANNKGTQATKCIKLEARGLNFEILLNGLANLKELRFLHVYGRYVSEEEVSNWNFDEDSLHLPNALRFLKWDFYPFSSLPKTFQAKNLVGLEMYNSNIVQLWKDGEEKAPNLEILILEDCYDLVEVHFQVAPNLKELRIRNCKRLEKLHMPESPKLRSLELSKSNLWTLDLGVAPNLESLDLEYCFDLREFNAPAECMKKLLHLEISYCWRFKSFVFNKKCDLPVVGTLSELHLIADHRFGRDIDIPWPEFQYSCYYKEDPASSFENLERLISLGFGAHINADSFSDIICGLQCLRTLTLEGGITEAPKNLNRLDCLEELCLQSTDIKTLPDSICMLKHLKSLKLESCLLLKKLPVDIGRLEYLESLILSACTNLLDFPDSIHEMKRLKCLELSHCIQVEKLPEEIGRLECLKELNIRGSGISNLPRSLYGLRGLRIIGDRWLLESCGLIPMRLRMSDEDSDEVFNLHDEMVCYI